MQTYSSQDPVQKNMQNCDVFKPRSSGPENWPTTTLQVSVMCSGSSSNQILNLHAVFFSRVQCVQYFSIYWISYSNVELISSLKT